MCIRDRSTWGEQRYLISLAKMLTPYLKVLQTKKIILGSKSAGRRGVLDLLGFPYEVFPGTFEEDLDKLSFKDPADYVKETCLGKLKDVYTKLKESNKPFDIIICADTIIYHKGVYIEKPVDHKDTYRIISQLAGDMHEVLSAVYILVKKDSEEKMSDNLISNFVEITRVEIPTLSEEVLQAYSQLDQPLKVSGGYAIQGEGATLIKSIQGCYYNVVGLPLQGLCKELVPMIRAAGWIQIQIYVQTDREVIDLSLIHI
eukprot:TRINITY_DN3316_c0_g2_i3.p1 TRINITY_DN3316_c0_g2~~TRINITY_DN3316_c0_g2_i3.p1  ORF type:complete len:277 (-),score=61.27 TRINITY_DN3316_c0_g2_i3:57-830(-)